MEWSERNKYNSFNSYKGLLYSKWYEAIIEWRDHKRVRPLPPIEVSLDPIHSCQLMCDHCNANRYLSGKTKLAMRRMPDDHLLKLVRGLGNWGVKGICFGGGGEPTLHTKLKDALIMAQGRGLESSIATNGIAFTPELIKVAVGTCRWIGVSVDSATEKTYAIGRKANHFKKAISNLEKLVKAAKKVDANCDISFKFLIFDYNQHEIYDACRLAKEIGVKDFHARPADWRHQGMEVWQKKGLSYNLESISEQMERCHEIEDKDFRVFTVTHKFNTDFTPKRHFTQCLATPICIQLCADGSIYLCPDTRHDKRFLLGKHYPDPENILKIWGSDKHYNMVFGMKTALMCKSRCTFSQYNEQCESIFAGTEDPMCANFV